MGTELICEGLAQLCFRCDGRLWLDIAGRQPRVLGAHEEERLPHHRTQVQLTKIVNQRASRVVCRFSPDGHILAAGTAGSVVVLCNAQGGYIPAGSISKIGFS